jgi:hypothetical protein
MHARLFKQRWHVYNSVEIRLLYKHLPVVYQLLLPPVSQSYIAKSARITEFLQHMGAQRRDLDILLEKAILTGEQYLERKFFRILST